ncbi:MAG: S8 family peptidase, partial [Terriglobales bacterium]
PNPVKLGGAGVCWYCSLMIVKVSRIVGGQIQLDDMIDLPNAINWAATSGAQAINLSLGGGDHHCPTNPYDAYCFALSSATLKEVVIAAAAGNSDRHSGGDGHALGTALDFPAISQYTIAVGAIQSYSGVRGNLWTEETPNLDNYGSSTGPGMETRGILAPGRDVLSTFYYGQVWNAAARCGSTTAQGTSKGPNYGVCTGTSMATPHITGIVGLLRTINPLLTRSQITSALLSSGDNATSPNTTRGYGVPNVATAVNTVLATTNRLTPLFSHYSSVAWDHFYTVAPQMARASIAYGLLPYAVAPTTYAPYGTAIAEYPQFPQYQLIGYVAPRAQVWVFSTHVNPFSGTVELLPIYRLSWKCGDPGTSVCGSNPKHVSHFYSTDLSEVLTYLGVDHYSGNGMEGYVYPLSLSQPPNTTLLMRAYNPSLDDYALFPQQEQANMASQGYTQALTNLGYVYLNAGSRPTY